MTMAESAPAHVDRARRAGQGGDGRVDGQARGPRAAPRPGSPKKQREAPPARAAAGRSAPARGTVRLSSSVVGIDSTSAHSERERHDEARIQGEPPCPQRQPQRPGGEQRRAPSVPKTTKASEARPALARVPGQARPAHGLADDRRHAVARSARTPQTAAAIHRSCAEDEHEREHGQRIEEDAERVARAVLGVAPQARGRPSRGSTCQLKTKAATAMSAACGQVEVAQQEGEAAHRRCGPACASSSPRSGGIGVRPPRTRSHSTRPAQALRAAGVGR